MTMYDQMIDLLTTPLVIDLNRSIDDRLNEFNRNVVDICNSYSELEPFISDAMKKINEKYLYEYASSDTLHKIHDEIHEMWKCYRFKYNEKLIKGTYTKYETIGGSEMGINMKENESEGKAFSNAMAFDTKDKETDEQIKPLPKSNGEWNKYLENQIMPNINKRCEEKEPEEKPVPSKTRPSRIEYYLGIADAVSKRSTCLRIEYGAIIVKNDRIISTGYNGAPKNRTNCCDTGECYRIKHNIPHGTRYETCVSCHAEANAALFGDYNDLIDSTLYLSGRDVLTGELVESDCCMMCKRVIMNARIAKVVFRTKDGGSRTVDVSEWQNIDEIDKHVK